MAEALRNNALNGSKALRLDKEEYDWAAHDIAIHREGEKIILPNAPVEMSHDAAIQLIARARDAENMVYEVNETIPVHFFDGLVALYRVLKEKFGYAGTQTKKIETWFGEISIPPKLIHVRVGPKPMDVIQVPFGEFAFPNTEAVVETKYAMHKGIPCLSIQGKLKSKEKKVVMEIVEAVREYASKQSIYKGRCVTLDRDQSGGIDYDHPLDFFDPFSGAEVPIFNAATEKLIETTLLAPVQNAQRCRDMKIPLKRGILLEGPYGTGKTLTARQAARVASENGWTFIHVTASQALKYGLQFAKMYQPCVLFAEDIDRITANRNEGANDLINEIDGIVGKADEIITVLTTNFANKIDKAMLRPGRLDAVISLREPDAEAVQRLVRYYARDLLEEGTDLTDVGQLLAGKIPATIREVVERSKLDMIVTGAECITADHLTIASEGMRNHMELLANASEGERIPEVGDLIADLVKDTVTKIVNDRLVDPLVESGYINRPKKK